MLGDTLKPEVPLSYSVASQHRAIRSFTFPGLTTLIGQSNLSIQKTSVHILKQKNTTNCFLQLTKKKKKITKILCDFQKFSLMLVLLTGASSGPLRDLAVCHHVTN